MDEIVKSFNLTLIKLINLLESEIPSNALLQTIKRRIKICITSVDRSLPIQEIGPEIYEYRELIADDRWDVLESLDWTKEAMRIKDSDISVKSVQNFINTILVAWKTYDDDEKKIVTSLVKTLLSSYAKYLCYEAS